MATIDPTATSLSGVNKMIPYDQRPWWVPKKQAVPSLYNYNPRIPNAVRDGDNFEDVCDVIQCAVTLEKALYDQDVGDEEEGKALFRLRKALEGIFGNELPEQDEA